MTYNTCPDCGQKTRSGNGGFLGELIEGPKLTSNVCWKCLQSRKSQVLDHEERRLALIREEVELEERKAKLA